MTREQLVEKIWGKDVYLDTDNSINGAIRKIRQVLKDDPERPRFIRTITGKGYRFIGSVVAPVTWSRSGVGGSSGRPPGFGRRFHDLRHTFGSLLIQDEASLACVKERMGCSSNQVTVGVYGHLIPGADIAWVDGLDRKEGPQHNATPAQPKARTGWRGRDATARSG